MAEWAGDHPLYLAIVGPLGDIEIIDLDEKGWVARYSDILRAATGERFSIFREPGEWFLIRKMPFEAVLSVIIREGEQAYYTAHQSFIWMGQARGHEQVTSYGIGKKRVDGNQDNAWWFPHGQVLVGTSDDADQAATMFLGRGLPRAD